MPIKLTGAVAGPGLVRLAWVLTPQPTLTVVVDGKDYEQALTASTILFVEDQKPGKHTYQLTDPATLLRSNKITLTVV